MSTKLRILIAYPYMTPRAVEAVARMGDEVELMVDSGAFTAFHAGKEIRLSDYCAFIRALPVRPFMFVVLDVIGDPVRTRKNYDEMRAEGLAPVPVWTRGDSIDALEHYSATAPVVCIGGVVRKGISPVPYLMSLRRHLHGKRVHLLGVNRMPLLKALRPYSCDSSNFTGALRFGRCDLYMGAGRIISIKRDQLAGRIDPRIVSAVSRTGYDIAALRDPQAWRGEQSLSARITMAAWMLLGADVRARIGTRMYLSGSVDFDIVWSEYSRIRRVLPAEREVECASLSR